MPFSLPLSGGRSAMNCCGPTTPLGKPKKFVRSHWAAEPTRSNGQQAVSRGSDPDPAAFRTHPEREPRRRIGFVRNPAVAVTSAKTGRYAGVIFKLAGNLGPRGAESEGRGRPERGVHSVGSTISSAIATASSTCFPAAPPVFRLGPSVFPSCLSACLRALARRTHPAKASPGLPRLL